jgi:hypothetical protein
MSNVEIPCPVCGEPFITAEPVDPSRRCRACTVPDALPRLIAPSHAKEGQVND